MWNHANDDTSQERKANSNIFKNGIVDTIDLVLPDGLIEKKDFIYLGPQKLCRIFALQTLPRNMYVGILNELFDLGNIDVSSYIENIPDGEVISRLTDKYSKIESNLEIKTRRGEIIDYAEKLAAEDLDALREAIQTNKEKMFYIQTLITVWGKNEQELNDRCDLMKDVCARKSMYPRVLILNQADGFTSALPFMNIKYSRNLRNITTGALSCLIPTGNTELTHKSGIYLGENMFTNSSIFYDNFIGAPTVTNPHMMIVGMAGAGKSVLEKLITFRGAAKGEWDIILDPEEEYKKVVDKLGGQYLVIKPGEKSGINPFDLEAEDDGKGGQTIDIYGKLSEIRELLSMFMEKFRGYGLKGQEITTVEEVVKSLYSKRGITREPESLYEESSSDIDGKFYTGKIKKHMPTLGEMRSELEKSDQVSELSEMMKIITNDGSMSFFDCESSIDLSRRVVGISLKHISDEFTKFFATVNILSWIWSKFSNWKYKNICKRVVVDEGWLFAKYEHSAAFLEEIARRGRKYRISLVISSQMINEFLSSEAGKAVIHQCATKIIMKQDASVAREVSDFFKLSSRCKEFLSTFTSGQALLLTEQNTVIMQVIPFEFEWEYIRT
ncbi:VirB4 family type IV secretion system protein [Clostridium oryzae]|uniref:AAA-like domain protein n=1 Tax=Clostridium oryzae TaxID=1450648 RepID=A0A1V4III7_9CLOT|nr:ATP-binding protein [Clostridium oryzae]OPJ59763.1 AAA-like domain protein [Clostridium oryzae]